MKKLILSIAALLLALTVCFTVLAESNAPKVYDSLVNLLFATNNVTVTAKAEFSLDGEWFKTAEGTWKQDFSRSFRELTLRAPKADGSERKNGYTIITEDDKLFLMETFTPGIYKAGGTASRQCIFRNTVETEMLINLGRALMANTDMFLGSGALTENAEGQTHLVLGPDASAVFNAALNEAARFAVKRYFDIDYDIIGKENGASLYSYNTKTQGLLYSMKDVSVQKVDITATCDANGDLQHVEGTVALYVSTAADGVHQLDVKLQLDATDRGATMVKKFNPADYQVNLSELDSMSGNGDGYSYEDAGNEEYGYEAPAVSDADLLDDIGFRALQLWSETACDMKSVTNTNLNRHKDEYEIDLMNGNGSIWRTFFKQDGRFSSMQAEPNDWQVEISKYNYDSTPDAETDEKVKSFLMDFLQKATPEVLNSVNDLKAEWTYEANGAVYAQYNEYPLNQQGDGVLLVVRISPNMQIEYYSCTANC